MAALAFGPIHNITTKTLELVQVCFSLPLKNLSKLSVQPGEEEKGLLGKLLDKLRALFRKKQAVAVKEESDEKEVKEDERDKEEDECENEKEPGKEEEESKKDK